MTPAEELNAAADKLEKLAAAASLGQWFADPWESQGLLRRLPGSTVTVGVGEMLEPADVEWVAAASPVIAPHLAAWLRRAAALAAGYNATWTDDEIIRITKTEEAIALARVIHSADARD